MQCPPALYALLDDPALSRIEAQADEILETVGLWLIDDPESLSALADHGARVVGDRVFVSGDRLRRLIRQAPARFVWRGRVTGRDVVVGAGAKVLGGFSVGDGAKVGSNAVVTKPLPPGATAVGNPARIIQAEQDARREAAASKMGFSAYGVTQNDDPLSQAMRGLIDNASSQEHQIALLWKALEQLCAQQQVQMPGDAHKTEAFEADKLNQLVGK